MKKIVFQDFKTLKIMHIMCKGLGTFNDFISNAPNADLNVFGLVPEPDFDFIEQMTEKV